MTQKFQSAFSLEEAQAEIDNPVDSLGASFLQALAAKDFDQLRNLYKPEVRFRAIVPSGERNGNTAGEAVGWLQKWFGSNDSFQFIRSTAGPVFDRLYLSYQIRLHGPEGWQVIEQHAYCKVQDGQIADMWLICSGFRPDLDYSKEQEKAAIPSPQARLGGDVFYNAGSKGCAEGPLDDIARLLRPLAAGQTLELYATDPTIASDLSAWCRLSGHALVRHEDSYYLIQRK